MAFIIPTMANMLKITPNQYGKCTPSPRYVTTEFVSHTAEAAATTCNVSLSLGLSEL